MQQESVSKIALAALAASVALGVKTSWGWGYSTPNAFGGMNIHTQGGMITTMPNVFGGSNIHMPGGRMITTTPNVFGGYNWRGGS